MKIQYQVVSSFVLETGQRVIQHANYVHREPAIEYAKEQAESCQTSFVWSLKSGAILWSAGIPKQN